LDKVPPTEILQNFLLKTSFLYISADFRKIQYIGNSFKKNPLKIPNIYLFQ